MLASTADLRHHRPEMVDRLHLPRPRREVGPYRSPGRAPAVVEGGLGPGLTIFLIDGCMVLLIALTVVTIGRWSTLVDVAARQFMGF